MISGLSRKTLTQILDIEMTQSSSINFNILHQWCKFISFCIIQHMWNKLQDMRKSITSLTPLWQVSHSQTAALLQNYRVRVADLGKLNLVSQLLRTVRSSIFGHVNLLQIWANQKRGVALIVIMQKKWNLWGTIHGAEWANNKHFLDHKTILGSLIEVMKNDLICRKLDQLNM